MTSEAIVFFSIVGFASALLALYGWLVMKDPTIIHSRINRELSSEQKKQLDKIGGI